MEFTDDQIENYLINHIKKSIENDAGTALEAYKNAFFEQDIQAGFFAIPRLLFPEIDGLGSYFTGESEKTTHNIKTYLDTVMGEIDPRYKKYAGFIAVVYRHGLLHQHGPKKFKHNNQEVGWEFSLSNLNTTPRRRNNHLNFERNSLCIDMDIFYQDTLVSINFAKDKIIKDPANFKKSYLEQNAYLKEDEIIKKSKCILKADFSFLEETNQTKSSK